MKALRILSFLILVFLLHSCATIFFGARQNVYVTSDPSGAKVFVNGVDTKRVTPCEIKVKRKQPSSFVNRKNEIVYVLKKENHFDGEYKDMSKFNLVSAIDWYYLIIPGLVDKAVGSDRTYSNEVSVKLNQASGVVVRTDTVVKKEFVYVNSGKASSYQFERKSDIDNAVPQVGKQYPTRFALVIGNEDYSSRQPDLSSEVNVDFARNDASAFKDYAMNTLGIPEKNIIFYLDATTGQMNQGISKMNLIIKNTMGNAEVFVYYAGHGLPDEQTKEAYIIPVDVSGKNASEGIKLKDMYSKLTEFPSKRVTVFIDACFSGGARNQGLVAARGVKVKPKADALNGGLIVFTASSGEQSSLPYKEQQHGFFTYFLLKKLQETKGNVSYKELSNYIKENVSLQSVLVNDKEQSPQVNVSSSVDTEWEGYNLK